MKLLVVILSLLALNIFGLEPNDQNMVILSKDEKTRIMLNFDKLIQNFNNEDEKTQKALLAASQMIISDTCNPLNESWFSDIQSVKIKKALLAYLTLRPISQSFSNQIIQQQAKGVLQALQNELPTLYDEVDAMKNSPSFLSTKIDWLALKEIASEDKKPKGKLKQKRETLASWIRDRRVMFVYFIADILLFSQSNLFIESKDLQFNDPRRQEIQAAHWIEDTFFGLTFWLYFMLFICL